MAAVFALAALILTCVDKMTLRRNTFSEERKVAIEKRTTRLYRGWAVAFFVMALLALPVHFGLEQEPFWQRLLFIALAALVVINFLSSWYYARPEKASKKSDRNLMPLAKAASGTGCLVAVLGPLLALVLYPRASWLFAFALIGVVVIVLNVVFRKGPTADAIADHAEELLNGGGDVDSYEHMNPREPNLRDLWSKTMEIGGLPEEWVRLDENKKAELRSIICVLRELRPPSGRNCR